MQERRQILRIDRREYFGYVTKACIALGAAYFTSKLPNAYGHSGSVIEVPPTLIIPEIDGKYTPVENLGRSILGKEREEEGWVYKNEWEDARLVSLRNAFDWYHGVSNLAIKHDENWVYGIVDFISDEKNNGGDWLHISIDTKNDGGNIPQIDDYLFGGEWHGRSSPRLSCYMRRGTGKETEAEGWSNTLTMKDALIASSKATSPNSDSEHLVYEFKISKKYFGGSPFVGMYLNVLDSGLSGSFMIWPFNEPRFLWSQPSTWGDIEFLSIESKYAIPESSRTTELATAAIIATTGGLAMMKRRTYLKSLPGLVLTGCL